jgi:hypothetical protein
MNAIKENIRNTSTCVPTSQQLTPLIELAIAAIAESSADNFASNIEWARWCQLMASASIRKDQDAVFTLMDRVRFCISHNPSTEA